MSARKREDTLKVKTVEKGQHGEDTLHCEPVVVSQTDLRLQYLVAAVEALAASAKVTLPSPPAGYIAP